jgi:hypothetical protein
VAAVIDWAAARLDAAHRRHLHERYFLNTSHQVIILSTDTDLDRHYYQLLQPAVARAYHLHYDDDARLARRPGLMLEGRIVRRVGRAVMSLKQIRLSAQAKEQLIRLKTRTGVM